MKQETFTEFLSRYDDDNGEVNEYWAKHWEVVLRTWFDEQNVHNGDCVGMAGVCLLCMMETWLADYRQYIQGNNLEEKK